MSEGALLLSQVVNGLVLGFLYVLIAVGLSIIFGMLGVVNFAHGAFFALGAYFALSLRPHVGPAGVFVLAPLLVGLVGMAVEATLLRPLYGKDPLLGLLLTFGLALFVEELIRTLWGTVGHPFDPPRPLSGFLQYGPIFVTRYRLAVLVISGLGVGVAVSLTIQFWPAAAGAVMYLLMAVVLLVRPRGLLGERWEQFE